jgi:hypothetical protein
MRTMYVRWTERGVVICPLTLRLRPHPARCGEPKG